MKRLFKTSFLEIPKWLEKYDEIWYNINVLIDWREKLNMRLCSFYVKSYRSIDEVKIDDIRQYCVIAGPNNSGKSNLLRALYIALSLASSGNFERRRKKPQYSYIHNMTDYVWKRDIPVSLAKSESASTIFKLTFEFSDDEKNEFRERLGINLSKSLQMKFQLYSDRTEGNIIMPGRAKKQMEKKIREIGFFIQSKLNFEYIPCVRPSELTAEYFSRLLDKELRNLESQEEYQKCMETLRKLQQPILENMEVKLAASLKTFIPSVEQVEIDKDNSYIGISARLPYHSVAININDGVLTSLEDKGDGIKSLAAIGIVQSMSFENAQGRSLMLLIEEPEAHLHPDAVHSLRNVLIEISNRPNVQVIISTHSPILIDRENLSNNIIVLQDHKAFKASSISQIRETLGVRTIDNLSFKKAIIVEGESDKRYFEKICSELSVSLGNKMQQGEIAFVNVDSASKVDYQVRLYNSMMIPTLVILDSDSSGISMKDKLLQSKVKLPSEILMIKSAGMRQCELEDVVAFESYIDVIKERYNIVLDTPKFKSRKKVWSDRLQEAAESSPGAFDDDIEASIKKSIADIVVDKGIDAIANYDMNYIKNIVETVEKFTE